jgi:hypothetical protein
LCCVVLWASRDCSITEVMPATIYYDNIFCCLYLMYGTEIAQLV